MGRAGRAEKPLGSGRSKFLVMTRDGGKTREVEFYLSPASSGRGVALRALVEGLTSNGGSGWWVLDILPDGQVKLHSGMDGATPFEFDGFDGSRIKLRDEPG